MKLWYSTDHETFWPVGGASIVIAENEDQARELLYIALREKGLKKGEPFTLVEVDLLKPHVLVLNDGDY